MSPAELSDVIKVEASGVGFDLCGITDAGELTKAGELFSKWLEMGCHGEMEFLNNNVEKRNNPSLLVPEAKSVIVVALNYYSSPEQVKQDDPVISRYASGIDYHIVMKQKLKNLLLTLKQKIPGLDGESLYRFCTIDGKNAGSEGRYWTAR